MTQSKSVTVFYTDDDEEDLEFFKDIIKGISDNVKIITHQSGKNLLVALNNPPPDPNMLFLDLNMPGMTGFDVLRQIRENEILKELPIIIFTTSQDDEAIAKSRNLGANYFVTKTGNFNDLKKSIAHALNIDWSNFHPSKDNFVYTP